MELVSMRVVPGAPKMTSNCGSRFSSIGLNPARAQRAAPSATA
jgi:hypothetical protein